jgi:hypothetical protein
LIVSWVRSYIFSSSAVSQLEEMNPNHLSRDSFLLSRGKGRPPHPSLKGYCQGNFLLDCLGTKEYLLTVVTHLWRVNQQHNLQPSEESNEKVGLPEDADVKPPGDLTDLSKVS